MYKLLIWSFRPSNSNGQQFRTDWTHKLQIHTSPLLPNIKCSFFLVSIMLFSFSELTYMLLLWYALLEQKTPEASGSRLSTFTRNKQSLLSVHNYQPQVILLEQINKQSLLRLIIYRTTNKEQTEKEENSRAKKHSINSQL